MNTAASWALRDVGSSARYVWPAQKTRVNAEAMRSRIVCFVCFMALPQCEKSLRSLGHKPSGTPTLCVSIDDHVTAGRAGDSREQGHIWEDCRCETVWCSG